MKGGNKEVKKILVAGAGGAPSEGVIWSLKNSPEKEEIVGMGSVAFDLAMSRADRKYLVPYANDESYRDTLLSVLNREKPALVHFQNDLEVYHASVIRNDIESTGAKCFMPCHKVIETCVSKWKSWKAFRTAGIKVPESIFINDRNDLRMALKELGDPEGNIWLRAEAMGGGGIGSIKTNEYDMANSWISRNDGWGRFIAAELLTKNTITWLSIWYQGELIVAQTRRRDGWIYGNRSASGVTGVTKVGVTCSDDMVDTIAIKTISAVDDHPHGIYGVDMTYDRDGIPNPTEINIARFFTTIRFFTEAGLNMPVIYKDLALYGKKPKLEKTINPLPEGLMWLRAVDAEPVLMTKDELDNSFTIMKGKVYENNKKSG